jgi:hypothetical protein
MGWGMGRSIKIINKIIISIMYGGRGEIRTHETVSRLAVFKTAALNHSATLPAPVYLEISRVVIQSGRGLPLLCYPIDS